jgi:hypothetical protein
MQRYRPVIFPEIPYRGYFFIDKVILPKCTLEKGG